MFSTVEEYLYEPNDIESDSFLSDIPLSLMKENIKAQFEYPLEYRKKDHVTTFINSYKYLVENPNDSDDNDMESPQELRDEFYIFMRKIMDKYLGVGFPDFDDRDEETQDQIIHLTYRFFLMNIKKNFVTFIVNSIEENRDTYIEDDEKKKDVTSLSFKKEITDPYDVYVISNLENIIDEILSDEIDIDDFFKKCDDDGCLETTFVSNAYDNFYITGNFVENYISMIDPDFKSEIESKVRNKILKKYKKK